MMKPMFYDLVVTVTPSLRKFKSTVDY